MKRAGWNLLEKRTPSSVTNERWQLHGKVIVVKVDVQQPDFSFLTSVDRPPSLSLELFMLGIFGFRGFLWPG